MRLVAANNRRLSAVRIVILRYAVDAVQAGESNNAGRMVQTRKRGWGLICSMFLALFGHIQLCSENCIIKLHS